MRQKIFSIVRTLIISILLSFLVICLSALLMWKFSLSEKQIRILLYVSYILPCLLGGFCFGHIFSFKKLLTGLGFGICYFLFLVLISLPFSKAVFSSYSLIVLVICCSAGIIGSFFS